MHKHKTSNSKASLSYSMKTNDIVYTVFTLEYTVYSFLDQRVHFYRAAWNADAV